MVALKLGLNHPLPGDGSGDRHMPDRRRPLGPANVGVTEDRGQDVWRMREDLRCDCDTSDLQSAPFQAEFLSEAARVAPAGWQPPGAGAGAGADPVSGGRLPSGAESRSLPLAVSLLLARRLAALPSVGGKRKRDCGRPPRQLAVALRDAAAAALAGEDASLPTPPPLPAEVWEVLEEVGGCLESAGGQADPSGEVSEMETAAETSWRAASLAGPLRLALALPLEHLSEPVAGLLLPLLCLTLLCTSAAERARRLALSALTALLASQGCRRPLEKLQPGRLLAWLASAPPSLPSAPPSLSSASSSLSSAPPSIPSTHGEGTTLPNGVDSEDDLSLLTDLNDSLTADDRDVTSPQCLKRSALSLTSLLREYRSSAAASRSGFGSVSEVCVGGCAVSAARRALLSCYPAAVPPSWDRPLRSWWRD